MNKINVNDKTERIVFGKIIELRGNFKEIETEEGITYECDMYRTRNKNATFKELDNQFKIQEAKEFLKNTDWIYAKCAEEGLNASERYGDIVEQRKASRALIHELE